MGEHHVGLQIDENNLVTKIINFKNFTKIERAIKNTSVWFRLNYKKLNFTK